MQYFIDLQVKLALLSIIFLKFFKISWFHWIHLNDSGENEVLFVKIGVGFLDLGHSLLIPCSLSEACILLFNANFSTCKQLLTRNFMKKNKTLFFIVNAFFSKQVISALMIVVDLLYFSSIHHFLFTCIFNRSVYVALTPLKKEKLWTPCTSFLFYFVHFKCYCFRLYWIKTKPYFA